jgi:hypothetical protein
VSFRRFIQVLVAWLVAFIAPFAAGLVLYFLAWMTGFLPEQPNNEQAAPWVVAGTVVLMIYAFFLTLIPFLIMIWLSEIYRGSGWVWHCVAGALVSLSALMLAVGWTSPELKRVGAQVLFAGSFSGLIYWVMAWRVFERYDAPVMPAKSDE